LRRKSGLPEMFYYRIYHEPAKVYDYGGKTVSWMQDLKKVFKKRRNYWKYLIEEI
jgi:hypothetical protein